MLKQIAACVLVLFCAGCVGWLEPGADAPTLVTPSYPVATPAVLAPALAPPTAMDVRGQISDREIFACASGDRIEARYTPDRAAVQIIVAGRTSAALARVHTDGYLDYAAGAAEFRRAGPLAVFVEAPDEIVVQHGDTLSRIALRLYGDMTRTGDIARANAGAIADPDRIRIGQSLRLPHLEQRCRRVLA